MMKQILRAGFLAIMLTGATAYAHGPSDHGGHTGHNPELAYGEPGDPQKPSRNIVVRMLEADGKMSCDTEHPVKLSIAVCEIRITKHDGQLQRKIPVLTHAL